MDYILKTFPLENVQTNNNTSFKRSQTNLAKELTDQIVAQDTIGSNVPAIKTKGQMLGTLLDIRA